MDHHHLRELYVKYDTIIKYSVFAFTGWLLSWILFFIMLPFMIRYYGKVKGSAFNYGFSWFSMFAIIISLEIGTRWWKGDKIPPREPPPAPPAPESLGISQ